MNGKLKTDSLFSGVPDIYQGTEMWDLSLVDPDNRRPVDYTLRAKLLEERITSKVHASSTKDCISRLNNHYLSPEESTDYRKRRE